MQKKITSYFKSKRLNVFLLFLILAVLFSVLSKLSKDYTQSFSFKIIPVNVPEDHVIIKDSSNIMDITLTTYGFKQIQYYFFEPSIEVDFSKLNKDDTHYIWTKTSEFLNVSMQFDGNVIINTITPDTLAFRYDVNSVKMIPLILDTDVEFSTGYDITKKYKLEPDSVKVIGPKVITDSIFEIKTNTLALENVNTNINTQVDLKIPKIYSDLKFSHETVNVTATVERFTEGAIDVPVNVTNIPGNIKLNFYPKVIPVIYYTSLSNFKSISSSSFIIECDYSEINDQNKFLTPKIVQIPDQVKSAKLNARRIEFIIQ